MDDGELRLVMSGFMSCGDGMDDIVLTLGMGLSIVDSMESATYRQYPTLTYCYLYLSSITYLTISDIHILPSVIPLSKFNKYYIMVGLVNCLLQATIQYALYHRKRCDSQFT